MKALWEKYRSVALYLIFGAVTTAVNVAVYYVCCEVLGVANVPGTLMAWAVSVAVAYLTNKLWVFDSKSFAPRVLWPELGKFVGARAFTGVLDLIVMYVGVDVLGGPGTPVKLGSNVLVIVLNYVLSKLVVFQAGRGKNR